MKKISMQDIADKAGVSRCTVSLALSGKAKEKRISDSLAKKIISIAEEMNYEPNELARGLRTGETKTIGVIVTDISNEFFGELVYHIQQRANALGYSVIITNSDEEPGKMLDLIHLLINRQVDGIIMVPSNDSISLANHIVSKSIPLVQVDRFLPGLDASYVVLDNFKASAEVTEMLYNAGCRRIAMLKHKTSALNGRLEGYMKTLQNYGVFDETLIKNIDYSDESRDVEAAIDDLFTESGKVDAVFFQSHELFLSGIKCINRKGVSISEEVKIASFDKIDAFALVNFPLIYVEQPISEIGSEAVDILVKHIKGSKEIVHKVFEGEVSRIL